MSTSFVKRPKGKKKNTSNRANVEKYAGDAYDLALQTYQGLKYIKKLINVETKYFDNLVSGTTDWNGSVTYISAIAQGTDITQRVGDSIKLQRLRLSGTFFINTSATRTTCRVVLFRDLSNAGSTPSTSDVISNAYLGTISGVNMFYNWINVQKRFSILYDEKVALSINGNENATVSITMPHEGHVKYRGTSGAVGSAAEGSIFLLLLSDEQTNVPTFSINTRVEYTDD